MSSRVKVSVSFFPFRHPLSIAIHFIAVSACPEVFPVNAVHLPSVFFSPYIVVSSQTSPRRKEPSQANDQRRTVPLMPGIRVPDAPLGFFSFWVLMNSF